MKPMKPSGIVTLAACTTGLLVSLVPIFFAGTGVLMVPITTQTGWSRGHVSSFISAGLIGFAVGAAIVGKLINIWGPRRVILCGTVVFPLALLLFSFSEINSAIALAFLVGLTGAAVSQFSYVTVLPRFFDRRLGTSLGIAMFGMGMGVTLMPLLLHSLEQSYDWRGIYRILAAIVFVVSTLVVGLFLHEPSQKAADKQKDLSLNVAGPPAGLTGPTVREALRGRVFWQLALATVLATAVISGFGIHLTSFMLDSGYTTLQAAGMLSLWGIGGTIARLFGGMILDYCEARWVGAFFLTAAAVGAIALASGLTGAVVGCAVFALATSNGMENDIVPYMTRRYFGARSYETLYGLLGSCFVIGPAIGAVLMGKAFDRFGNYHLTLLVVVGALLAAALLFVTLGAPLQRSSQAEA
jgi:MFS transporter, OFA family, oxalate/formate antiporter